MPHVLILRSRTATARSDKLVREHERHLERHHANGTFLASGAAVPDTDGEIMIAAGARGDVEKAAAEDSFVQAGAATWQVVTFDLTRVSDELAQALGLGMAASSSESEPEPGAKSEPGEGADHDWDSDELRRLRYDPPIDLAAVLAGRRLRPVLQQVGQALLARFGAVRAAVTETEEELAAYARRCVAELAERGWSGDDDLARELSTTLGEPVEAAYPGQTWPLQPVPVVLADLAEFLDGDPREGRGVVDLVGGAVHPPGIFDLPDRSEFFPELDEENESYDPDRWLTYEPHSDDGYRDMVDFAESVADERLQRQLWRALEGRGPFRRFRDVLADAAETESRQWFVFRDERSIGRAREFLAQAGFRAAPPLVQGSDW